MASTAQKVSSGRRTAAKETRRQQLIKATIKSVAKRGFADTTMADVTREAGLSLGIVNLHFQSKDNLFEETLRYLSDEYESLYTSAAENAGPDPADKLCAMVELDFSTKVSDRRKLAVWFAFWGAAKTRPTYLQICAENDRRYGEIVASLFQQIINEDGYDGLDAESLAIGLAAIVNGLWLDLLMTPEELSRDQARAICYGYLASIFPDRFSLPEAD